jgi:hypothetical protein
MGGDLTKCASRLQKYLRAVGMRVHGVNKFSRLRISQEAKGAGVE